MYWTTLSLFLAGESFFHPILSWVPFYSWMRLGLHLYLVLPGQQGSVFLYQSYLHPFLERNERDIDRMISDGHDKAKKAGLSYMQQAIEYVKVNVLGMQPKPPSPPPSRNVTYTQALLSRFAMPNARNGLATAGTSDILSVLGTAMQHVTYPSSQSRDERARDLSSAGGLIPPNISGEERTEYISTQRDKLKTLLQAFDREAFEAEPGTQQTQPAAGSSASDNLKKSRSEAEFEDLAYEDVSQGQKAANTNAAGGGGWGKWIWGNYGEKDSVLPGKKDQ